MSKLYEENLRFKKLINEIERTIKYIERDMKNATSSNEENKKLRIEIIKLAKTIIEKDNINKGLEKAFSNKDAEKEKDIKEFIEKIKE